MPVIIIKKCFPENLSDFLKKHLIYRTPLVDCWDKENQLQLLTKSSVNNIDYNNVFAVSVDLFKETKKGARGKDKKLKVSSS